MEAVGAKGRRGEGVHAEAGVRGREGTRGVMHIVCGASAAWPARMRVGCPHYRPMAGALVIERENTYTCVPNMGLHVWLITSKQTEPDWRGNEGMNEERGGAERMRQRQSRSGDQASPSGTTRLQD